MPNINKNMISLYITLQLILSANVLCSTHIPYFTNGSPGSIESRETHRNPLNPLKMLRTFTPPDTNLNEENQILLNDMTIQIEQLIEEANKPVNLARRILAKKVNEFSSALDYYHQNVTDVNEALTRLRITDAIGLSTQISNIDTRMRLVQTTFQNNRYDDSFTALREKVNSIEQALSNNPTDEEIMALERRIIFTFSYQTYAAQIHTSRVQELANSLSSVLNQNDPDRFQPSKRFCEAYSYSRKRVSDASLARDVEILRRIMEPRRYYVGSTLFVKRPSDSVDALHQQNYHKLATKDAILLNEKEDLLRQLKSEIQQLRYEKEITPLRMILDRALYLRAFIDEVSRGPDSTSSEEKDMEGKENIIKMLNEIENEISLKIETYKILRERTRADLKVPPISLVTEKYTRIVNDLGQKIISQAKSS